MIGMKLIPFLLIIASCTLIQKKSSLDQFSKEELLNFVKITGQGRGRVTFKEKKYSFEIENYLNKKNDLIMVATIPLHGEEVMIFKDLKQSIPINPENSSFEQRLLIELQQLGPTLNFESAKLLLSEIRSFFRLILAGDLGKKRNCQSRDNNFICELEGETFLVETSKNELKVIKILDNSHSSNRMRLRLIARNLTESFFQRVEIQLKKTNKQNEASAENFFSWEFFW